MSEYLTDDIAEAIAQIARDLPLDPPLKAYTDPPSSIFKMPCVVVDIPEINRRNVEEGESEVGSYDWRLTYPVGIFVELRESGAAHLYARHAAELFIRAIDESFELAALVTDAVVTNARPEYELERERPAVLYVCTVDVFALEPNQS